MHCRLLVADQHVLEFVLFKYLVVDIKNGAAWIAKNEFDLFLGETAHDDLCARQMWLAVRQLTLTVERCFL